MFERIFRKIKPSFRLLFAAILVLFLAIPAWAGLDHYTIDIYRDKGYMSGPTGHALATTGVQYMVLQAGTQGTLATLYSDKVWTEKTNPVTATVFGTDGQIDFYVDDSTYTSLDIIVVDNTGGYTLFMDGITPSVHTAVLNERPNEQHHGMIWYTASCNATDPKDSAGGTYDTGVDIAAGTFVESLSVEVVSETVTSDILMAVGLGGDNDGLIPAAETDKLTGPSFNNSYLYYSDQSETFYGALMVVGKVSDAESGTAIRQGVPYLVTTDASLTYGFESADEVVSDNFDSAGYGFIHYWFTPARVW